MKLEFDSTKNRQNFEKHGLWFEDTHDLEWDTAVYKPDNRKEYGEQRFVAYVPKRGRLYIVCITLRRDVIRIISYRKANSREEIYYAKKTINE